MEEKLVTEVPKKSDNLAQWYIEIIKRTELADYAPMKGMMVIRPSGYAIWENIQRLLDKNSRKQDILMLISPFLFPKVCFTRKLSMWRALPRR